ncbi:MAG TPA: PfkB family carbohydrate kinase, partial [Ramlibacter sp.]|nr:PfkB family carbohydrate kinase [Ramlibacter sp.]
ALALQGVATAYLNSLSGDAFGRQLADGLVRAGVVLAHPHPVRQPTSLAVVDVDADGQPRYSFYRDGVADRAGSAADLVAATRSMPGLRAVCTGCLALAPQEGERYLAWLRDCRARGLLGIVDANLRPSAVDDLPAYRAQVFQALALADVVKASDEDLAVLLPGEPPLAAARALLDMTQAQVVALTLGAQGAVALVRNGAAWHACEEDEVDVVDTVGAGDCFLAGFAAGLLPGQPIGGEDLAAAVPMALARGVASASHCIARRGCAAPTAVELTGRPPVPVRRLAPDMLAAAAQNFAPFRAR